MEDKTREGTLCRFNQNNRAYRVYSQAKETVVKSRNYTFLETPPCAHFATNRFDFPAYEDNYQSDAIDFTPPLEAIIVGV